MKLLRISRSPLGFFTLLLAACSSPSGSGAAGNPDSGISATDAATTNDASSEGGGTDSGVPPVTDGGGDSGSGMQPETGGPACTAANCPAPGCCDANGVCQPGTADDACAYPQMTACLNCPVVYGAGFICDDVNQVIGCESPSCGPGQPACTGCCDNTGPVGTCYPGNTNTDCGNGVDSKGIPGTCGNCTTYMPPATCTQSNGSWVCQ